MSRSDEGRLARSVGRQHDTLSVKVWRSDGLLAWTDADKKRIGRRFPMCEVYAPIESTNGSHAIGASEIYADPRALGRLIGARRTMLWLAVGVAFLVLSGLPSRCSYAAPRGRSAVRTRSSGPEPCGPPSPTACSRRAHSKRSRASTRRWTQRIRTPPDTRSVCSASPSPSARSSGSSASSSTSSAFRRARGAHARAVRRRSGRRRARSRLRARPEPR